MAGALGGPATNRQVLVRGRKFHPKLKDSLADQLEQNNVVARDMPCCSMLMNGTTGASESLGGCRECLVGWQM